MPDTPMPADLTIQAANRFAATVVGRVPSADDGEREPGALAVGF